MINTVSVTESLQGSSQNQKYVTFPFYFDGKALPDSESHARWGMTLLKAGSMRFRWTETNENRARTLKTILKELRNPVCSGNCSSAESLCDCKLRLAPIELIHSKDVFVTKTGGDTKNLQGDGIITKNPLSVPCITVADCVPIFLYDKKTKSFGAFHSGWRGTGIVALGARKMREEFGSNPEDISAAIGPHIENCCYRVDEERAEYFAKNFGGHCVKQDKCSSNPKDEAPAGLFPYRLSLTEANLFVLRQSGIKEENIVLAKDCTCCARFKNGDNVFGSFRREAAFLPPETDALTRSKSMTVQAGFVYLSSPRN